MMTHSERSLRRFAFEKSTELIRQIFENANHLKGNKGEESLHAMRVGSRRLREAWGLFALFYPVSRLKKQAARVRRLTRTLGLPREMDVNLALLSQLELCPGSSPELKLSWEYLLDRMDQDRKKCRRRMRKKLEKIDLPSLQSGLFELAERGLKSRGKTVALFQDSPSPERFLIGPLKEMSRPLGEKSAEQASKLDDGQLHQLRIAAKKFRYALEITNPLFGDSFNPLILKTRELQSALGLNQDLRMLIQYLHQQADSLREDGRAGLLEGAGQLITRLEEKKFNQRQGISALHSQFRESLFASVLFLAAAKALQSPGETG